MTNKEAMEEITERICMKCKYLLDGDMCARCYYQKALDVLKATEKYRWHDLRKNPEDLPQRAVAITGERICYESDEVLVYNEPSYFLAAYNYNDDEWYDTDEYLLLGNVIAWKYIEPFEEEE